jgi:glycosyltransferase involved in cell wall biosynthesis
LKNEPVFSLTVPAKIQAYMASSKIILGSLNGEGQKLINESGCGIAVEAENPELLYAKLLELKKMSSEERKEMEKNAKKYYEANFSQDKLFDELESHMLETLRQTKSETKN